jgi:hypothetical protein
MQQTQINGSRYSFTDVTVEGETAPNYGGIPFVIPKGVLQSINWTGAQDAGIVQGNQISMVGRTDGYGVGTGDMELLLSECDDFFATITGNGAFPVMSVYFNLRVTSSVNGSDVRLSSIVGIKITNVEAGNTKGNDASTRKMSLSIAQVYENGIALWGDPPQQ